MREELLTQRQPPQAQENAREARQIYVRILPKDVCHETLLFGPQSDPRTRPKMQ